MSINKITNLLVVLALFSFCLFGTKAYGASSIVKNMEDVSPDSGGEYAYTSEFTVHTAY